MAEFQGFPKPKSNYFRLPHMWTDITHGITSIAEMKVMEYIARHTWGFQEYGIQKRITLDEFMHGRKEHDGKRMDKGTGLSERAIRDGIKKALEHGYINEEVDDRDKARVKRYFSLVMETGGQMLPPTRQMLPHRGAAMEDRSEKETLESKLESDLASIWSNVLTVLKADVNGLAFKAIFANTSLVSLGPNVAIVGVPNSIYTAIQSHEGRLERVLSTVLNRPTAVEFTEH